MGETDDEDDDLNRFEEDEQVASSGIDIFEKVFPVDTQGRQQRMVKCTSNIRRGQLMMLLLEWNTCVSYMMNI